MCILQKLPVNRMDIRQQRPLTPRRAGQQSEGRGSVRRLGSSHSTSVLLQVLSPPPLFLWHPLYQSLARAGGPLMAHTNLGTKVWLAQRGNLVERWLDAPWQRGLAVGGASAVPSSPAVRLFVFFLRIYRLINCCKHFPMSVICCLCLNHFIS